MTPEKDTILSKHPKDAQYWRSLNYDWIIPHLNATSTADDLIALVKERYGPDMNWYDEHIFPFLIKLAKKTQDFYARPWVRKHLPLPQPSEIMVQSGVDAHGEPIMSQMELTPWMEEVASYSPEDREVRMYTNGEYKRSQSTLLATMVMAVDHSNLFSDSFSYNSLFKCLRDDAAPTLQKYRAVEDPTLRSSIAVVLPNKMVKLLQRHGNQRWNWDELNQRLIAMRDENTFTLEELQNMPELSVQHVINCSGEGSDVPYCLSPTAHSGFNVNMATGEIYGSYDHSLADGTVVQSFFMQVMYDIENHHQSGLLKREDIHLPSQQREEFAFMTVPGEQKQAISMLNMPDLSYTDLMMVMMRTRANEAGIGPMRSVTGTATSNYPRPITGDKLQDHYAAMENRISILQEQYSRHSDYMELLNRIKAQLQAAYGTFGWVKAARTSYTDELLSVIPREDINAFIQLREQSKQRIRQEIEEAREDKNMSSKIIDAFHGSGMNWKATRLAQKLMRKKMLGNVNGTLVSQMTLDEGQIRPKNSPDYFFTTITPDSNNAGLTVLRRTIISNRAFFQKHIFHFIEDLDRHPQTLSRTSHVLYYEDSDPDTARSNAICMLSYLYENWILMSALVDITG